MAAQGGHDPIGEKGINGELIGTGQPLVERQNEENRSQNHNRRSNPRSWSSRNRTSEILTWADDL